jgi:hypothetical protein
MKIWTNEKVAAQLFMLRMRAVAAENHAYAALLTTIIERVEAQIG